MFLELIQYSDIGLYILRVAIALIFLKHDLPKLLHPMDRAEKIGWPTTPMFVLGLVSTLAALGLIVGIYIQLSAFAIVVIMLGALYHEFFKWNNASISKEFDFILLAAAVAIILTGGGSIGLM